MCLFTTNQMYLHISRELADRHTRPNKADWNCISVRTSRTLHQMSTLRVHRAALASRRTVLSDYFPEPSLPVPGHEYELTDDDDIGSYIESTSMNFLSRFDDFENDPSSSFFRGYSRILPPLPPLPMDSTPTPLTPVSMPMVASTSSTRLNSTRPSAAARRLSRHGDSSSSSSLNRQHSLRRTGRARTTDFHDFTSRRRSEARDLEERARENVPSGLRDVWTFLPGDSRYDIEDQENEAGHLHQPLQPSSSGLYSSSLWSMSRRQEVGGVFPLDTLDPHEPFRLLHPLDDRPSHSQSDLDEDSSTVEDNTPSVLPPFQAWLRPEDGIPRLFSEPEEMGDLYPRRTASPPPFPPGPPRLRRGGLRAPEAIATEHIHALLSAEHEET
jgi:hypothetical protein